MLAANVLHCRSWWHLMLVRPQAEAKFKNKSSN